MERIRFLPPGRLSPVIRFLVPTYLAHESEDIETCPNCGAPTTELVDAPSVPVHKPYPAWDQEFRVGAYLAPLMWCVRILRCLRCGAAVIVWTGEKTLDTKYCR